jgi:hypothetical protein
MNEDQRSGLAYRYARESGYFSMCGDVTSGREMEIACRHTIETVLEFNDILAAEYGQQFADHVVREYLRRNYKEPGQLELVETLK